MVARAAIDQATARARVAEQTGDSQTSLTAWREVLRLADERPEAQARWYRRFARYSMAGFAANDGETELALGHLEAAFEAGFDDLDSLPADGAFKSIQGDARFLALVGRWEPGLSEGAGPEPPDASALELSRWAEALQRQAKRALAEQRLDEANELAGQACEAQAGALGQVHPLVGQCVADLGVAAYHAGELDRAREAWTRALKIIDATLGPEDGLAAVLGGNLAVVLKKLGDYAAARDLQVRSLARLESLVGPDHDEVATILLNLARLERDLGELDVAEQRLRRALSIRETIHAGEHLELASVLTALGQVLLDLGDAHAARLAMERALAIRQVALPQNHPDLARSLNDLATVLQAQGELAAARALFEQSLDIAIAVLGDEHPFVANQLSNVALVLHEAGDDAGAEPLVRRSLEISRGALGPEHERVAAGHDALAEVLVNLGRPGEARAELELALSLREQALGATHPQVGTSLVRLARLEQREGKSAAAKVLVERALGIAEGRLGEEHPTTGEWLGALGLIQEKLAESEAARVSFERSLAILEAAWGEDHPRVVDATRELAELVHRRGETAEAQEKLRAALTLVRGQSVNLLSALSGRQQHAHLDMRRRYVDSAIGILEDPSESYREVLFWKGLVQRAATADRFAAGTDDGTEALREELLSASSRLDHELRRSVDPAKPREAELRAQRVRELSARREQREIELSRRVAGVTSELLLAGLEPQQVRGVLRPSEVFIDYLESRGRLHAWVLRADAPVTKVTLGASAEVERAVERLRTAALSGDESVLSAAQEALARLAWRPLQSARGDATRVLIAPDGALATLPFGLMPGRERADGRPSFLLEDVAVVHLPSGAMLLGRKGRYEILGSGLLAVGDVHYGGAGRWKPLPATGREVAQVAQMFRRLGGAAALELTGIEASEQAVVAALGRHRYLHLATHGFFPGDGRESGPTLRGMTIGARAERPVSDASSRAPRWGLDESPLARSGLVLAGANAPGEDRDGLLSALEIGPLDLRGVELCVLSACGTALGRPQAGQGVIGLSSALLGAGVRSLVLSSWSVPDEATAGLMESFYGALWSASGSDVSAALREAQLALLQAQRREGRVKPLDWAGWIVMGVEPAPRAPTEQAVR